MASQYNARKEMLSGTPKISVSDVDVEISKVRSSTPKPVCCSVVEKDTQDVSTKKLLYKHELKNELESFKSKLEAVEQLHTDLTKNFQI